jgi:hypothetical protein
VGHRRHEKSPAVAGGAFFLVPWGWFLVAAQLALDGAEEAADAALGAAVADALAPATAGAGVAAAALGGATRRPLPAAAASESVRAGLARAIIAGAVAPRSAVGPGFAAARPVLAAFAQVVAQPGGGLRARALVAGLVLMAALGAPGALGAGLL